MTEIPKWALRYQEKGTQIVGTKSGFYLYKIKSVWDPSKKRARKVTERYLGKVTPEGVIKSKQERIMDNLKNTTVKELGASYFTIDICSDIISLLKNYYTECWKEIFSFSVVRLFYSSPIKNIFFHYHTSHLSDAISNAKLSPKSIAGLLTYLGMNRRKMTEFLKNFVSGTKFEVIDLTHIFSLSENVISATLGHNSEKEYLPQINLVLIFSVDENQPSFFRLVPGAIRDVSTITATLNEAGIKDAVVIGDKGFYSEDNIIYLEDKKLGYIVPLKRNSSLIDYNPTMQASRKAFDGYFLFENRVIWHSTRIVENRKVILYLDERLKTEEIKGTLLHVETGKINIEEFYNNQDKFGTIAVITRLSCSPKEIYELLKSRVEIEQAFDTFKNLLHADRSYMRDDTEMQGWMFINFISLLIYYKIYRILVSKNLLRKWSPKDVIIHLSRIQKLKIGEQWLLAEKPKQSRELAEKLKLDIHIT